MYAFVENIELRVRPSNNPEVNHNCVGWDLLSSIKSIITEYIPAVYPQYLADYPDSLTCIYGLIKETINTANKLAETPS